jgi:hypothetical protein
MGDEHLAYRPSLEFSHAACGDDRNPLALEALHQLLPSAIVVVDEHDGHERINEQVTAAATSPFEQEGALTDAGKL